MQKLISIMLLNLIVSAIQAQEYIEEGKKRLNFATTYFEFGSIVYPAYTGKSLNQENFINPVTIVPNFTIGGIHFWGHADFYVSFPLSVLHTKTQIDKSSLTESGVTGLRYMPWAFKIKRITPYVGTTWTVLDFKQNLSTVEEEPSFSKNKVRAETGFMYGNKTWIMKAGISYYPNNQLNYPVNINQFETINLPAMSFYVGLSYNLESTKNKKTPDENLIANKYKTFSKPQQDATRFGDWFLGIGPSTSFMLATSDYNNNQYPYLNPKPLSHTFIDVGLGYHFNKARIITALAYRNPEFSYSGYGVKQEIKKTSLAAEIYYYLMDYSGFAPFVGINVGIDKVQFKEDNSQGSFNNNYNQLNPGITFGWDILPNKTQQPLVLRTNLRWYPWQKINVNGESFNMHQIEYNFIQAVYYPSRKKKKS